MYCAVVGLCALSHALLGAGHAFLLSKCTTHRLRGWFETLIPISTFITALIFAVIGGVFEKYRSTLRGACHSTKLHHIYANTIQVLLLIRFVLDVPLPLDYVDRQARQLRTVISSRSLIEHGERWELSGD